MNELYHHGIKGQKWGVRRYQNSDGTLTAAGKVRKQKDLYKATVKYAKKGDKIGYKDYVDYQKKLGSQIDKKDLSSLKKIAREWDKSKPDVNEYQEYQHLPAGSKRNKELQAKIDNADLLAGRYVDRCNEIGKKLLGQYADIPVTYKHRSTTEKQTASAVIAQAIREYSYRTGVPYK